MVSDVAVAYRTSEQVQHTLTMPCTFTDEEFKEEVLLAEASGFVSDEDFKKSCFEKWGVVL